jgi:hypothetical protein
MSKSSKFAPKTYEGVLLWLDMSGSGRTYSVQEPDISGLPGLFTLLSVNSSWVPHRAFTSCFFSTHDLYSLMFGVLEGNGSW